MTHVHDEPTPRALAAIEAEWPVIAAEIDLVEAECRVISDPADALALCAHRRAINALLRALVRQINQDRPVSPTTRSEPTKLHSTGRRSEAA